MLITRSQLPDYGFSNVGVERTWLENVWTVWESDEISQWEY